jgi:hypothetical protein
MRFVRGAYLNSGKRCQQFGGTLTLFLCHRAELPARSLRSSIWRIVSWGLWGPEWSHSWMERQSSLFPPSGLSLMLVLRG